MLPLLTLSCHAVRRHAAALVSRRWHRCAHAPELCRSVSLDLHRLRPTARPAALDSLAAWLLRHGQHVRKVELEHHEANADAAENGLMVQLGCCLMACAAGTVEAFLLWSSQLLVASWAPSLRSVRKLRLDCLDGELVISSSLHGLTQLTNLSLGGSHVRFSNAARLPTSVERLWPSDYFSSTLPSQVGDCCLACSN